jgi:diguanylate cyclase (GGDEF)-like protein/PAS domain S-box-containing protein
MTIPRLSGSAKRLLIANLTVFVALLLFVAAYAVASLSGRTITVRASEIRERYEAIQRETVKSEVDRAVERILALRGYAEIDEAYGSRESLLQLRVLDILAAERFGVGFNGYFFVADSEDVLLIHPAFPELIGKSLKEIDSGNGESLGALFSRFLAGADSSFVSYQWRSPSGEGTELKTSYVRRIPDWNWTIGSGYYLREFNDQVQAEADEVVAGIESSMKKQLLMLGLAAALAVLVGLYFAARSLRLERVDQRRVLELEQYKRLLDEVALVSRTDPEGRITYVNDRFCQATGRTRESVVGLPHSVERHPSTPKEAFADLWATIKAGKVWHGVIKNRRADGSSYFKSAAIMPIQDETGAIVEYIAAGLDVTELIEQRGKLERAFHTDPLTGLGSRIKLLEDIDRAASPAVALLDISDFSRINDAYGEEAGNAVLREFGGRMAAAIEREALGSYRVYADTFAILADGVDSFDLVKRLKAIRERVVQQPFAVGADQLPVNLRIGVACGNKDVLAYADLALGAARDRDIDLFTYGSGDESLSEELLKSVGALKRIHSALRSDRVYPVFQPISDARTGEVAKYECLMRARDEEGVELSPAEFIPVSKKTRLYPALTRAMVEKSIQAFAGLPYMFSVNLTLEDLFNPTTVDFMIAKARDAEVIDRMVVEIVETEELVGFDEPLAALKRIKAAGARLAIDDFGAGYSNFGYLLELDPDYVKIDGSIVSRIVDDPRAEGLARSIVSFAQGAGIATVAEFVSDESLAEAARRLGIDYLQGYWIGAPAPELPKP